MSEQDTRVTDAITKETRVTIGVAALTIIALFSAYFKADARLRGVEARLSALEYRIEALTISLEAMTEDRWTRTNMYYWSELVKANNPDMMVPAIPEGP